MDAPCPEPSELEAFVDGRSSDAGRAAIEQHLHGCADCRFVIEELAASWSAVESTTAEDGDPSPALLLSEGDEVGRYRIERRLGEGAMGVVYAAYDPELQRRVALKFLRPTPDSRARQARVAREARATARLSHPNVVGVHEVGTHRDHLYIVLELVDGTTLSQWRRTKAPTREQVLEVFVAAGRGLAAAHAVGLVHRDFKPDNVLIDGEGRVRVTDFGLARVMSQSEVPTIDRTGRDDAGPADAVQSVALTTAGAMVGTPAYMSPEQFAGLAVDARADQFSYCVALYEALFDKRPFAGKTPEQLAANVAVGSFDERPLRTVPGWLRALVRRGLAIDPAERYPTMDALLDELGRDRSLRRRLLVPMGLGAGAVGMLGIIYLLAVAGLIAPPDPESSRLVRPPELTAPPESEPAPDPAQGDAVRADLKSIEALIRAGRYADALPAARTAAQRAAELGEGKLLAIAHYRIGSIHSALGEPAAAEKSFIDALVAARDHDAPEVETEAAIRLVYIVGYSQRRFDDAQVWVRTAEALLDDQGTERQHATLASYRGAVAFAAGDYEASAAQHRRSLEIEERLLGPEHADVASTLHNLAGAVAALGRPEEALRLRERALAIITKHRGADHEQVASHLRGVAALEFELGRYQRAHEHWQRALDIRRVAFGEEHPDIATSLDDIGNALEALGRPEEALPYFRQALAMREKLHGERSVPVADTLHNLGRTLLATGAVDEAIEVHQRAVDVARASLGDDHPELADQILGLGDALARANRRVEAIAAYERALDLRTRALGPQHPDTVRTRAGLAELNRTKRGR